MRIALSIPHELIAFADAEARRQGASRSALLSDLVKEELVRVMTARHLDRHEWDVADDEASWREYQRRSIAETYRTDEW